MSDCSIVSGASTEKHTAMFSEEASVGPKFARVLGDLEEGFRSLVKGVWQSLEEVSRCCKGYKKHIANL